MADPATLGVVVCTHTEERRALLHDLVRSLAVGDRLPDELVIVVDRNPALLDQLQRDPWPLRPRVVASTGSGLAAARNTGWRALTTDVVAFIDDDAVASRRWLADLGRDMERLDADVIGGRIDAEWEAGRPAWYTDRLGWIVGCSYEGQPTTPQVVRNVIGCNMLIRRSVLDALGGFETALGRTSGALAGCEETELCIRATEIGAAVVLTPGAAVSQVLPPERGRATYALRRAWHEGRSKRLLTELHGGVLGTEASYTKQLLREAGRRVAQTVARRSPVELERAAMLLAVLATTAAGYGVQAIAGRLRGIRPGARRVLDVPTS